MAVKTTAQPASGSKKWPQDELQTPTRTMYIHNHTLLGTTINATDLTPHLTKSYADPGFVAQALEVALGKCKEGQVGGLPPTWTIRRNSFFSRAMDVVEGASGAAVASWRLALFASHASELTFPDGSAHSSHPITVRAYTVGIKEHFVADSVEYVWKIERGANVFDVNYKLVKRVAGRERVVARYAHPPSSMYKGGILSVDEGEVDVVVALVTCCVMIKKRTQKDIETWGIAS